MNKLKKNISSKWNFQFLMVMAFFAITGLKAQQADFSGTWVRNTDKCDMGDHFTINSVPVEIIVIQNPAQIEIRRISKNFKGDTTDYAEKVKFDGTQTPSIIRPNLNKKASIQWSPDQKGFIENATYADDQGNPKQSAKEIWTFDSDGKILRIQLTLTINGQDFLVTEVFDKKN